MGHHYTRNTVEVTAYCKKCEKDTRHGVNNKRLGPCLECVAKLDEQNANKKPPPPQQGGLF